MSVEDQGIIQKRKELERKYADLETEKNHLLQKKQEKENELNEFQIQNEEITNEMNQLFKENNAKKTEIEEKEKLLLDQDNAIKNQKAVLEKLKKKKRFIWCG